MILYSYLEYLYMAFLGFFTQFLHGLQPVFNMFLKYQIHWVWSSEHPVTQTLLPLITVLVQLLYHITSLIIVYSSLVFNSSCLTLFGTIYDHCRPPSHHNVLWKLYSSQFLTKCILLETFLVCLVSFPLFSIHTADFISNIMRGSCNRTTYGSLFISSLFRIMKCENSIPVVHAALYSLSGLYWSTEPVTCVKLSIGPPW